MSENPWADPSTPTEPGPPYAGPPYAGPPYAGPPYAGPPATGPGYGYPPPYGYGPRDGAPWAYGWGPPGYPGWPVLPPGPRRPGQVVAAAVLAFAQGALVLLSSLYVFLIATVAGFATDQSLQVPGRVAGLVAEGRVVALLQLGSVVLLVVAGALALGRSRRSAWVLLLVAFGVQLALAVYWAIRVGALLSEVSAGSSGGPFVGFSLAFAAMPLVGLGLVLFGPGRAWFAVHDAGRP